MVAFRQVAADTAKANELRHKRQELSAQITTAIAGRYPEDQIAGVFAAEGSDLKDRWDQRGTHLAELRSRIGSLHERRGACTHEMQQLAGDRRLAETQLELACVQEQLHVALRRWQVLAVIGQALDGVRKKYETERQPETLQEASLYLKELTLGQYGRVWMPLDRRALLVEDAGGKSLTLDVLSRGTREAIYISLRLALASSFARRGALLPLVFDDVLVNLDKRRAEAAARVFREFAVDGKQIMMFTCHEHIQKQFEDIHVEVRLIPERNKPAVEPEKPKRRRKEMPKPAAELPPPLPPPMVPDEPEMPRYIVDPNRLFSRAAQEEPIYDPTNLHELQKPAKSRRKRPAEAPRYKVVSNYSLPETWPVAQPPAPPPPAEDYHVISFRYLPDPAPPPVVEPPPPPTPVVQPPPPAQKQEGRQRFTWESPEMYWDDQRAVEQTPAAPAPPRPQPIAPPHFALRASKEKRQPQQASQELDAEYPQGWHF